MTDDELLTEWKRLQNVAPVGDDIINNGPHVIALIRFTLANIERLTALAEFGARVRKS